MEVMNMSKRNQGKLEYYTGIAYSPTDGYKDVARNVIRRFNEHRLRYKSNWMKRTRKLPRRIGYVEVGFKNKIKAMEKEKQIKRKSHDYKTMLIQGFRETQPFLAEWVDKYFSRYGRYAY